MSSSPDDLREARGRSARLAAGFDSIGQGVHIARRYVGQVIGPPVGAATPCVLDTYPASISGPMAPGGSATITLDTTVRVPVLVLGQVPGAGQNLVAKTVQGRWVAYLPAAGPSGPPGVGLPSCYCDSIPATLRMTSGDPNCNYQMFQSCTLQYGPMPGSISALRLGPGFYSTETFVDPLIDSPYYYYLTCQLNQFSLTRIYITSPYGSPYRDGVLYSWLIGGYGNTCSPFHLDTGHSFPGSDASCQVFIDDSNLP